MRKLLNKENCTEIGYVKKTHGVRGELQIFYKEGIENFLDDQEYIFFEFEGLLVPFFITEIFSSGVSSAIIQFDTLTSKEKASEFVGCKIFIETDKLDDDENLFTPQMLTGFSVFDEEDKFIGVITDVADYGGNIVFSIGSGRDEILVPFHEELLYEFNAKKKKISIEIPKGLIGLNDDADDYKKE